VLSEEKAKFINKKTAAISRFQRIAGRRDLSSKEGDLKVPKSAKNVQ
jgi:hypothetical protein